MALNPNAHEFKPEARGPTAAPGAHASPHALPSTSTSSHGGDARPGGTDGGVRTTGGILGKANKPGGIRARKKGLSGGLSKAMANDRLGTNQRNNKSATRTTTRARAGVGSPPSSSGRRVGSAPARADHLLNLQYSDRKRPPRGGSQRGSGSGSRPRTQKRVAYSKDVFVQANYRFLVSDALSEEDYVASPDKMLDWDDIAQVYSISEGDGDAQCPICLEIPVAAQTTTCGHVFCLACILRHRRNQDPRKKPLVCPLCFAPICIGDLRSLYHSEIKRPREGDTMEFQKLVRNSNSIFPRIPYGGKTSHHQHRDEPVPRSRYSRCFPFAKFTKTGCGVYEAACDALIHEIEAHAWRVAEEDMENEIDNLPYLFQAMQVLRHRYWSWKEHRAAKLGEEVVASESSPTAAFTTQPCWETMLRDAETKAGEVVARILQAKQQQREWPGLTNDGDGTKGVEGEVGHLPRKSTLQEEEEWEQKRMEDKSVATDADGPASDTSGHSGGTDDDGDRHHHFFQCLDGRNIFLHPLNIKCLVSFYGRMEDAPLKLSASILEIESFIQTEESRKRYRFLSHLPLQSKVQFCELDLSQMLPKDAVKPFLQEIRKRRKHREREAKRRDDEDALQAQSSDNFSSSLRSVEESLHHLSTSPSSPLACADASPDNGGHSESIEAEPVEVDLSSSPAGMSFARVTRLGFASGVDSPSFLTNPENDGDVGTSSAESFWAQSSNNNSAIHSDARGDEPILWEKTKRHGKSVMVMRFTR